MHKSNMGHRYCGVIWGTDTVEQYGAHTLTVKPPVEQEFSVQFVPPAARQTMKTYFSDKQESC